MSEDLEKKMFQNEFVPTSDDTLLLRFMETQTFRIFSILKRNGYSKDAIADGFIYAVTQWRNRP
jgi:hypothetical protein